jgi:hypothetical protein
VSRYAGSLLLTIAGSIISTLAGYAIRELPNRLRSTADVPTKAEPASGFVRIFRQIAQQLEKRRRLADEKSHGRQEVHHAHGNPPGLGWANDRTGWELAAFRALKAVRVPDE